MQRYNQELEQKLEDEAQINIELQYEISELRLNLESVRERLVNTVKEVAASSGRCEELRVVSKKIFTLSSFFRNNVRNGDANAA